MTSYTIMLINRLRRAITDVLVKKQKRNNRRRNLTKAEKLLFQLIKEKEVDGIPSMERDVYAIKQFFEQNQPSRLFNVNCYDEDGFTPLMTAVWECGDDEYRAMRVIMILFENGADINMQIIKRERMGHTTLDIACIGQTALHIACSNSSSNAVKFLLNHGTIEDLNHKDCNDRTPLLIASIHSKHDNMKALLEFGEGVDVNAKDTYFGYCGYRPIHNIIQFSSLDDFDGVTIGIKSLLKYGADVNNTVQDDEGTAPLHLALWRCFMKALPFNGIIIESHHADYSKELDLIRLLLDSNADVNIQEKTGFYGTTIGDTPLHATVRMILRADLMKVVQLLLEYHPNLFMYNNKHETALDIVKGHKRLYYKKMTTIGKVELDQIIMLIGNEQRNQIYKYLFNSWIPLKTAKM